MAGETPRRGLMLVVSSPSGAGKTSLSRKLIDSFPDQLALSISCTTRAPRPGEADGREYHFVTPERFEAMARDEAFLEHAHVHEHRYGTPRAPVMQALARGRDVLFDIDWQGTQQLAENAPEDLVSVFVLPPSTRELERRLKSRAQDSADVVSQRMAQAANELSHWAEYDYVIVNSDIEASVRQVQAILQAERLRRERLVGLHEYVKALREGQ